jgi:hypothetical protein
MRRATADMYAAVVWYWEAVVLRIAGTVADYQALMDSPLRTVALWYIKTASSAY